MVYLHLKTKTFLPKPRSDHFAPLLEVFPWLPSPPCPLVPSRAPGWEGLADPQVTCLPVLPGPRTYCAPAGSALLHLVSPGHHPQTQPGSLTAPHTESGLVCSLLSSHESLTEMSVLPAFPHTPRGQGLGSIHLPNPEPGTKPGTYQILNSKLFEVGFGESEPGSTYLLAPQASGWCPPGPRCS